MILATVKLTHPSEHNRWIDESPINIWLLANVGVHARYRDLVDEDRPWHVDHERDYLVYHFARENDATLFALKWGT
jgi:hypothetical protein